MDFDGDLARGCRARAPGDGEHVGRQCSERARLPHVLRRVEIWLAPRQQLANAVLALGILPPLVPQTGGECGVGLVSIVDSHHRQLRLRRELRLGASALALALLSLCLSWHRAAAGTWRSKNGGTNCNHGERMVLMRLQSR